MHQKYETNNLQLTNRMRIVFEITITGSVSVTQSVIRN